MGREKKKSKRRSPNGGAHNAKDRHKRDRRGDIIDWKAPPPPGLVARPDRPKISTKHKSWFEFIENKDKKKKLEIEFTETTEPPPGFEFVPMGNPVLTTKCKELSREQGAMIFIVTMPGTGANRELSWHLNRVGHHIRQTIFEEARKELGDAALLSVDPNWGQPEPIPESQAEITQQADAAIQDLFPRIPHTDRQEVLDTSFNKARLLQNKGDPPVGLAATIPLSRRVQLAVLAHIRHKHTRYDELLKETSWVNARKAVESLCLDYIVKWRGDEETGRDQLDEILCEVILISDSESEDSDVDEGSDDDSDESAGSSVAGDGNGNVPVGVHSPTRASPPSHAQFTGPSNSDNHFLRDGDMYRATHAPQRVRKAARLDRKAAKWPQRNFSRYQAAWDQAVERQRTDAQPEVVRLSHREMDLKDHLVPSIEPASPTQYPVQRQPEAPLDNGRYSAQTVSYHSVLPPTTVASVQEYGTYRGDEGFIRLPPRPSLNRMSIAPPGHSTSAVPVGQPSYSTTRAYAPRPAYGAPPYYDDPDPARDRPLVRAVSRPIWVDEHGRVLRSEARPFYVGTPPDRTPPTTGSTYLSSGNSHALPVRRSAARPILLRDSPDGHPAVGPVYVSSGHHTLSSRAGDERRYYEARTEQPVDRLGQEPVQIVRVTNVFPRRYGTSPVPVETRAHDYPVVSQPRYIENQPYDSRQQSVRVQPQRVENVVGVEYLPVRRGYETRTYTEQPLEEAYPVYRSRTVSAIPPTYREHEPPAYHYHPDPARDQVITIE
ncbi:hypothetical protein QBC35DRAFT_472222 [Podospora australis]|uniref:DUF2293 domain-containing protein n=1 Tax=Podospora australis TaxID=1536484 RepID=A0AAN6X0Q3_9PEZI|nr:hypothetical protein QBC35DRAFT_472222 [Podospora australis]